MRALALVMVLGSFGRASADRDVLREEMAKRDAALRVERAAAANLVAFYKRVDAASRVKLAQARAKVAEADAHERAGRIGSAFSAVTVARDLAYVVSDPLGERQRALPFEPPMTPTEVEGLILFREMTVRQRALNPSWLSFTVGVIGPSEIIVEQDGVVVPMTDWNHSIPIDGGDHVWTARMETFVFFRYAGRVPATNGSIGFTVEYPAAPVPEKPPLPRSQIAK